MASALSIDAVVACPADSNPSTRTAPPSVATPFIIASRASSARQFDGKSPD